MDLMLSSRLRKIRTLDRHAQGELMETAIRSLARSGAALNFCVG